MLLATPFIETYADFVVIHIERNKFILYSLHVRTSSSCIRILNLKRVFLYSMLHAVYAYPTLPCFVPKSADLLPTIRNFPSKYRKLSASKYLVPTSIYIYIVNTSHAILSLSLYV